MARLTAVYSMLDRTGEQVYYANGILVTLWYNFEHLQKLRFRII